MKNTVIIILALLIGFASCKKDEENEPSKEDLLCKKWNIEKYYINDLLFEDMSAYSWNFKTDGTLEMQEINTQFPEILYARSEWKWVDNRTKIEIKAFDKKTSEFYIQEEFILLDIKTLTDNSLNLEMQTDDSSLRIELIKP